jgi:hypothetical protein
MRALLVMSIALLTGCATDQRPWLHPYRPTTKVGGLTYCAKHHRPLVSVRGFQSSSDPLVLVHSADPHSVVCDERSPNSLNEDQHLTRTSLHVERTTVTYCPICAAEYWQCMGGDHQLTQHDIQQITPLALHTPSFRQPIIRIFPVYEHHVIVVGGAEDHVGDVFTDLGVAERRGRWVVAYPVDTHRITAVGQSR